MHIIFSILINLANLEKNLKKRRGDSQPANQPENPEKQINLSRNFQKNDKKFMPKYKNGLKLSHFKCKKRSILNLKVNLTQPKRVNLNLEVKFSPNKAPKGFKI